MKQNRADRVFNILVMLRNCLLTNKLTQNLNKIKHYKLNHGGISASPSTDKYGVLYNIVP